MQDAAVLELFEIVRDIRVGERLVALEGDLVGVHQVDHDLVFALVVNEVVADEPRIAAVRAGKPENRAVADSFAQLWVNGRIYIAVRSERVLGAALRAGNVDRELGGHDKYLLNG